MSVTQNRFVLLISEASVFECSRVSTA